MPKKRRVVESIDDFILEKDKDLETEYSKRISRVEGQLSTAKNMSRVKKLHLYNEMYSAQQAIRSIRQKIKMDMVVEIMHLVKGNKKAVALCRQLLDLLNKK